MEPQFLFMKLCWISMITKEKRVFYQHNSLWSTGKAWVIGEELVGKN